MVMPLDYAIIEGVFFAYQIERVQARKDKHCKGRERALLRQSYSSSELWDEKEGNDSYWWSLLPPASGRERRQKAKK